MTYQEAKDLYATARGESKPLENNTRLWKRGDSFAVRLHDTDVVTIHPDGTYTLDSGGRRTMTTRRRIEEYGPFDWHRCRFWTERNNWYIGGNWHEKEGAYTFHDGIRIDSAGIPTDPDTPRYGQSGEERIGRELDRKVARYIRRFAAHVKENGIADPDGGDCWGCYFAASAEYGERSDPMGISHLLDHIEEGHFVPSLLWNAVRERGYGDPSFVWEHMRGDSRWASLNLRHYFKQRRHELLVEYMNRQAREVETCC